MKWLTADRLFFIGVWGLLLDAGFSLGLSLATGEVPTGRNFAFWPFSVAVLSVALLCMARRRKALDRREKSLRMKETALLRYGAALSVREHELIMWMRGEQG